MAHYRRHASAFTAPPPRSRLFCRLLRGLRAAVEPGAGSGRRCPLSPSCRHTGAVCPACRDWGKGCDSSTCTGGWSWPPLPDRLGSPGPAQGHAAVGVRSGPSVGALHAASQGPWPGDSGLCHSHPEQGSAGDSCSPGGRAQPLPAAFPRFFPVPRQGTEPLLSFLSPWHQPGLKSLCRWGEETREYNSSSLGNKSHVYIGQLLARWHKRPWRSMTPGSSHFNRPAPLRLPGGGSQRTPKDPASLSTSGPKTQFFFLLVRF